jgi:hypothetical protein
MSRRRDQDIELPDLQTDADVDALMARLRARIEPEPPAPTAETGEPRSFADTFDDLVAAHEGLASSMVRAMEVIVETLEEIAPDCGEAAPAPPPRASRVKAARPNAARRSRR